MEKLIEAARKVQTLLRNTPALQGREHVDLGIEFDAALRAADAARREPDAWGGRLHGVLVEFDTQPDAMRRKGLTVHPLYEGHPPCQADAEGVRLLKKWRWAIDHLERGGLVVSYEERRRFEAHGYRAAGQGEGGTKG